MGHLGGPGQVLKFVSRGCRARQREEMMLTQPTQPSYAHDQKWLNCDYTQDISKSSRSAISICSHFIIHKIFG